MKSIVQTMDPSVIDPLDIAQGDMASGLEPAQGDMASVASLVVEIVDIPEDETCANQDVLEIFNLLTKWCDISSDMQDLSEAAALLFEIEDVYEFGCQSYSLHRKLLGTNACGRHMDIIIAIVLLCAIQQTYWVSRWPVTRMRVSDARGLRSKDSYAQHRSSV